MVPVSYFWDVAVAVAADNNGTDPVVEPSVYGIDPYDGNKVPCKIK